MGGLILDLFHDVVFFGRAPSIDDLRNAAWIELRNVHLTMHYHLICHWGLMYIQIIDLAVSTTAPH